MTFFATAETTWDVQQDEIDCILRFEERVIPLLGRVELKSLLFLGVVYVIMNPKLMKPFPPGIIFRKSRMELDVKPQIDFDKWKAASDEGRYRLLADGAIELIEATKKISEADRDAIICILAKAAST